MTSQTGKQMIATHIFSSISISKDNQTVKFHQLMEYNMRDIFLEKSCITCGEKVSPRPFYEKIKIEHISVSTQSEI